MTPEPKILRHLETEGGKKKNRRRVGHDKTNNWILSRFISSDRGSAEEPRWDEREESRPSEVAANKTRTEHHQDIAKASSLGFHRRRWRRARAYPCRTYSDDTCAESSLMCS